MIAVDYADLPVHQPPAPEVGDWYGGCDDGYPRVNPDGVCRGCGAVACAKCGAGFYPDGGCQCPA